MSIRSYDSFPRILLGVLPLGLISEPSEGFFRSEISGYLGLCGEESLLGDLLLSLRGCNFLLLVSAADPFLSVRLFFRFFAKYCSLSFEFSDIMSVFVCLGGLAAPFIPSFLFVLALIYPVALLSISKRQSRISIMDSYLAVFRMISYLLASSLHPN